MCQTHPPRSNLPKVWSYNHPFRIILRTRHQSYNLWHKDSKFYTFQHPWTHEWSSLLSKDMSVHLCFRSWEREPSDLPIFNFQPQMFMRTFMECFLHICGYRTKDRWFTNAFELYFKGMSHFSAFGWFIIRISQ